jgi:HCOMODA/2-hydroxy-3-carboxy-muconic semialdehyde decarboxylase
MSERAFKDIVIANRILAHLGVFDADGSISLRHPLRADRFLLACGRSPALVGTDDILQLMLSGEAEEKTARVLDGDRFIHAAIYEARPDVQAVLHANSEYIQPFTVSATALRPVLATVGDMGAHAPVWDVADTFGAATDLTVDSMEKARDLPGIAPRRADARRRFCRHRADAQRCGATLGLYSAQRKDSRRFIGDREDCRTFAR